MASIARPSADSAHPSLSPISSNTCRLATCRSRASASRRPGAGDSNLIDDSIYDYRNALIGYRYYDGAASASKTIDYTVDPLERPVRQVETISGQTTSYDFTYVGATQALSKEVLTGSGAATKRYAYDAFGNRATIAEGSNRYSYLYDPHGSVSLLIDQANTVKESYGYAAYGSANAALTKTAAGFNAKTNPYRYTGKRLDSGSGTYDMGARRYSASTGRFLQYDLYYSALDNLGLSSDPLTQNRYALAGGNPVNFVEVDGHGPAPLKPVWCPVLKKKVLPGACLGAGGRTDGVGLRTLLDDVRSHVLAAWGGVRVVAKATLQFVVEYRDLIALVACVAVPIVVPPSAPAMAVACAIYGSVAILTAVFTIRQDGGVKLAGASIGKACDDVKLVSPRRAAVATACQIAVAVAEAVAPSGESDGNHPRSGGRGGGPVLRTQ